MLSNLVISSQRTVIFIDQVGQENVSNNFVSQLLREQGHCENAGNNTIKRLTVSEALNHTGTIDKFLKECEIPNIIEDRENKTKTTAKWNVILPSLSDLLCYQRPAVIFELLHGLRKCPQVERTFLWASIPHLMHPRIEYIVAACEYIADMIVHLETKTELSIVTRKPGGGVTNKRYLCNRSASQFLVEPIKGNAKRWPTNETTIIGEGPPAAGTGATNKPEQQGTFKIELEEEEIVARNAVLLPYEKTSEETSGNIFYNPDADDDFDEEDPDEDLFI